MKFTKSLFATLVFASFTSVASAGAYIGATVGQADYDTSGFDDPTSYSLLAGYNFNQYFGVEVAYLDLGDSDDDIAPVWTIAVDGFSASLVGKYPVTESVDVFAKAGFYSWEVTIEEDGFGEFASEDGTDLAIAFGAAFAITPNIEIVGQYMAFEADVEGDSSDVSNVSVGVNYKF